MSITLDVTGFYYQIDVDSAGVVTVLDVLNRAQGVRAPNGGVLTYELDSRNQFLSRLTVRYDGSSTPQSRQNKSPFGPNRPVGTYSFADDVLSSTNRIDNSGHVPGLLAWQYYIFDKNGVDKNRVLDRSVRMITPLTQVSADYKLEDGDKVVWRLIAIFGLNQFIELEKATLLAESNGGPISLKSAARVLGDKRTADA